MRLITHNLLVCNVRACAGRGVPLRINATEITHVESEFKPEVLKKFIGRINWPSFRQTVQELGETLPEAMGEAELNSEDILKRVHLYLLDVRVIQTHVMTGALLCTSCGRAYPIDKGIPNMVLEEGEVA